MTAGQSGICQPVEDSTAARGETAQRHGDLVFSARFQDGGQGFLWLLFEHQSSVDRWMIWRMTESAVKFLERWHTQNPDAERLPAIIPIVLYHGPTPWNAPTSLVDLFDISDQARRDLADHLLSFCFVLDDLRTTDDDDIDARDLAPLPRLGLTVMKHATSEELIERLVAHADDIRALLATEQGRGGWYRILRYTWYTNPHIDRDVIRRRLVPIMGSEIEQNMLGYGQKLEKQAYDKGLEQGLEQGLARGQRALLLRLLERRFGSLPARVTERLDRASTEELERWSERILDAASLDELGL